MLQISFDHLFEGPSLEVGKVHWYLLRARTERHHRLGFDDNEDEFKSLKQTLETAKANIICLLTNINLIFFSSINNFLSKN